jgi:hypothetical protein
MTPFRIYWEKLKIERPGEYQDKLRSNRERIQKMRQDIYADEARHEQHKQKNRERYHQKRNNV